MIYVQVGLRGSTSAFKGLVHVTFNGPGQRSHVWPFHLGADS